MAGFADGTFTDLPLCGPLPGIVFLYSAGRLPVALAGLFLPGFALAAAHWDIGLRDCLLGYAWGWLENQVAAAIKLVPLGQTDGQRLQLQLAELLPAVVEHALRVEDDGIGTSAPALAIASARHETQYTRLFRS